MKSFKWTVLFVALFSLRGSAQTKTIDDANQVVKTAGAIKDLFKKKKTKETTDTGGAAGTPNASPSSPNVNILVKAGNLAPNVRYIDVDEMYDFNHGAALVKKGEATALIDSAGNFIVPFNKYIISGEGLGQQGFSEGRYNNGFFVARETGTNRQGFLNTKGTFFLRPSDQTGYMCGEYIVFEGKDRASFTLIDNNWKTYVMQKEMNNFNEGVGVSYTANLRMGAKLGYKKVTGQYVINPQYDYAERFWEGRAIIGKINEFGEMKYGFIDITGKEIFPCVLSTRPTHFSSGLAKIEPKDKSEFDYAYINRDGKVVIKLRNAENLFESFCNGYAPGLGYAIIDSNGKIMSGATFREKFDLPKDARFILASENVVSFNTRDEIITSVINFTAGYNWTNGTIRQFAGFFDIKTRKVVKAVFEIPNNRTEMNIRFDKVSRLSFAKMVIGYDKIHQKDIFREGYINEDGIFVIVKGQSSKW